MAPSKKDADKTDKDVKLTSEQSATLMLDYLRKQNRPYSATDISANLKNRVTKSAAAKLLKDMHERNEIEGRAAGKQIVYHAIQDEADGVSVEQLTAMEEETTRLKDETTALKAEEKELRVALREGAAQISLSDLRTQMATLNQQTVELTKRLDQLKAGNFKPVSLEERVQVDIDYRRWSKTASVRKKIRLEMWKEIAGTIEKDQIGETKENLGLSF